MHEGCWVNEDVIALGTARRHAQRKQLDKLPSSSVAYNVVVLSFVALPSADDPNMPARLRTCWSLCFKVPQLVSRKIRSDSGSLHPLPEIPQRAHPAHLGAIIMLPFLSKVPRPTTPPILNMAQKATEHRRSCETGIASTRELPKKHVIQIAKFMLSLHTSRIPNGGRT